MKISIAFTSESNYKHIENTCISAYIKDGFLKVKDDKNNLHCYNVSIIKAYHLEFGEPGDSLLESISRASRNCQ